MNVVTLERTRTCIRCHERFTEPAGTVTRICDDCRTSEAGASLGVADGDVTDVGVADGGVAGGRIADRPRERACVRCGEPSPEVLGEGSRLCPSCDPDHVVLG